jgi:hypothetical protein
MKVQMNKIVGCHSEIVAENISPEAGHLRCRLSVVSGRSSVVSGQILVRVGFRGRAFQGSRAVEPRPLDWRLDQEPRIRLIHNDYK